MLVEIPNKATDTVKDTNDVDEKEMIIPTAIVEIANASASSLYLDILVPSTRRRVAKRDIPKRRKLPQRPRL
jgi:hypothetical protein